LIVEIFGENYHTADIIGFSIVNKKGSYFIPTDIAVASTAFKKWAEDEASKKIVFNSKQAMVSLDWQGIQLKGVTFDVQLASYLLNPSLSNEDLAMIAGQQGIHDAYTDEAVYGKGAKKAVPDEATLADHVAR